MALVHGHLCVTKLDHTETWQENFSVYVSKGRTIHYQFAWLHFDDALVVLGEDQVAQRRIDEL